MKTESLKRYIIEINKQYQTHIAREHAYRPALKDLLQSLLPHMVVTNEPAHVECGAPDYIISSEKNHLPIFFVEAKDVGDTDLDGRNRSGHKEQFDRYKQALDHIIFTDYLDFHLYEHGQFVDSVRIAEVKGERIVSIETAEDKFLGMIDHLGKAVMQRVTSASRLAGLMAAKARLLANIIERAMNDPKRSYENDNLQGQYNAFKDVLLKDLTQSAFADIYAQTIAYGLFAARLHDPTPQDFSREEAARLIPKTNPFLRQIFNNLAGNDLDGRIAWVVDDLVTVFQATDLQKIMEAYRTDGRHRDPMIHFYEDFLAEYNPGLRKAKGVWYTPQPVVSFIVRAVDNLLRTEFGLTEGLADYSMVEKDVPIEQSNDRRTTDGLKHGKRRFHRVQILDPAAGTGTFLAEVVNQIYDHYRENQGIWQQYVEQHLLPRLNGFEILMASYAVAHIKLDMLLSETGYRHTSDRRLHIYLTNSLEENHNEPRTLFAQWLSREAAEANLIKRDYPVMVMIGNPPYSVSSQNKGTWITSLLNDYKQGLNERNIQPLSDDYIKFLRLAQFYIEKNGTGIVGFITNNSYLDGIIHRQMRKSLLLCFDRIYIVNLHGSSRKQEEAPDGTKDENVFDIMQGVAIGIFVRTGKKLRQALGQVFYTDLYGSRQSKYDTLEKGNIHSLTWTEIDVQQSPQYFFVPKDFSLQKKYNTGFKIDELFKTNKCGIVTSKDEFVVCYDKETVNKRVHELINLSAEDISAKYNLTSTRDWSIDRAKKDVGNIFDERKIISVDYRPFDTRYIYYTGRTNGLVARPRGHWFGKTMLKENISLLVCKQQSNLGFKHVFISTNISDKCTVSSMTKEASYVFPLYLYEENMGQVERVPNLDRAIVKKIDRGLGEEIEPLELFDYIYAVLHSPNYRKRFKEFLKIDFPRVPYPTDKDEYHRLSILGARLRRLHLMQELPERTGVTFPEAGTMQVDKLHRQDERVYINEQQYFDSVPEVAWNFFIGGYQPAQKWLKDRKGRTLDFDDVKHYGQIVYVLCETHRIMSEIDHAEKAGG